MAGFSLKQTLAGLALAAKAPNIIGAAVDIFKLGKAAVEEVQTNKRGEENGVKKQAAVDLFVAGYKKVDEYAKFDDRWDGFFTQDFPEPFVEIVYRLCRRFFWDADKNPNPNDGVQDLL